MDQELQKQVIQSELKKAPGDGVLIAACKSAEKASIETEVSNVQHVFLDGEIGRRVREINITIKLPEDCVLQEHSSMSAEFNEVVLKQLIESLFGYYDVCASEVDSDEE